jgi:hypothetical protein
MPGKQARIIAPQQVDALLQHVRGRKAAAPTSTLRLYSHAFLLLLQLGACLSE